MGNQPFTVDVLVIGAGQAGIAAGVELQKAGLRGYAPASRPGLSDSAPTFMILDAGTHPGGGWVHLWPGMAISAVHGVEWDGADIPANRAVPQLCDMREEECDLPVVRPVRVVAVTQDLDAYFSVTTTAGQYRARILVNCTGTWSRPFIPYVPGQDIFRGVQMHAVQYWDAEAFWRKKVILVGGDLCATLIHSELSRVTKHAMRETAVPSRLDRSGAWWGAEHSDADVLIWCTGFRPEVRHLAPMKLRRHGHIALDGLHAVGYPYLFILGTENPSFARARDEARMAAARIREILA